MTRIIFCTLLLFLSCEPPSGNVMVKKYPSKKIETVYLSNQEHDIHLSYYNNGVMSSSFTVDKNGTQNIAHEFYESGRIKNQLQYLDDELHGDVIHYYENGFVRDVTTYDHGDMKVHHQYNQDGSKRGVAYLSEGNEFFKRTWTYSPLTTEDRICSIVNVGQEILDGKLRITFSLPLVNEDYPISELWLSYWVKLFEQGKITNEIAESRLQFSDFQHSAVVKIDELVDSLVIIDQISYDNIEFPSCSMTVKMQTLQVDK